MYPRLALSSFRAEGNLVLMFIPNPDYVLKLYTQSIDFTIGNEVILGVGRRVLG